ncbi:MAG: hypothetical protein KDC49_10570 [Saprospiraceae bacterium]|nr:hypothetical protein [Saprospiraceae bacterium]
MHKLSKWIFIFLLTVIANSIVWGQISINTTGDTGNSNAALDVSSTEKGMLIPRMTASNRLGINNPAEGLLIFQIDGSKGFYLYNGNAWTEVNKSSSAVPIGSIIDWWRPNAGFPLPEGYKICDGSVINEPQSPINGQTTPAMSNRFVIGTTNPAEAGELGGTATHTHQLSALATSSNNFNHNHTFNYGTIYTNVAGNHSHELIPSSGTLSSTNNHNHTWSLYNNSAKVWTSYNSAGNIVQMIDWGDGMDSGGAGHYPIQQDGNSFSSYTYETSSVSSHNHTYQIPAGKNTSSGGGHSHNSIVGQKTTGNSGGHEHTYNSGTITSDTKSNHPKNMALLKLMRIY